MIQAKKEPVSNTEWSKMIIDEVQAAASQDSFFLLISDLQHKRERMCVCVCV